ncbi:hypothetical protein AKJ62_01545, partial [candidate division MSBL1 archaeon SCGC-AAA259D14]
IDSVLKGGLKFLSPASIGMEGSDRENTFNHIFKDSVIDVDYINIATTSGRLSGEVDFRNVSLEDINWVKGRIIRNFPVVVKNEDGRPVSGVSVSLLDNENKKVWTGETNENGRATFTIGFNENNYDKNWRVEANYPTGGKIDRKINFLSDTPVVIPPSPELSVVNIGIQPREIEVGETGKIIIDIRNTGSAKGQKLELVAEGIPELTKDKMETWVHPRFVSLSENGEIATIKIENASLNPGEERHISISASFENAGTHKLTVGDESKTIQVRRSTQPYFKVTNFSISEENVGLGEEVNVSVEVINNGEEGGTYAVELSIDGEIRTKNISLKPDENQKVTFEILKQKPGSYNLEVGKYSKSIEVVEPVSPPEFKVSQLSISSENVKVGEEVTVYVRVKNTGGEVGTHTVELSFGGSIKTENVTLKPNQSKEVTFEISKENPDNYIVEVGSMSEKLEVVKPTEEEKLKSEDEGLPLTWIGLGIGIIVALIIGAAIVKKT